MSRQAHVNSVIDTISQLDRVRELMDRASSELDTLADLMENAVGDQVRESPGAAALSRTHAIRSDLALLLPAMVAVRTDLVDYLEHI